MRIFSNLKNPWIVYFLTRREQSTGNREQGEMTGFLFPVKKNSGSRVPPVYAVRLWW